LLFCIPFVSAGLFGLAVVLAQIFGWAAGTWLLFALVVFAFGHFLWGLLKQAGEWLLSTALIGLAVAAVVLHYLTPAAWKAFRPYIESGLQAPADVPLLMAVVAGVVVVTVVAVAWKAAQEAGYSFASVFWPGSSKKQDQLDVRVCPNVIVKHNDRYLHTMVVGTSGTGKTSRVLKPMIWQDLKAIADGALAGITVIEPKGDFAADVAEMARDLGVPVIFLNPEDPASPKFNPMEGPADTVAEIMRTVLQSLFGRQEAFFRQAQEVTARNTVLLLKAIKGDDVTMLDLVEALRDEGALAQAVELYEKMYGEATALVQFFRQELLGRSGQKMYEHTLGLRLQLEDITGNALLRRVLMGKSDVNLDRHLEGGSVLVVNTAMGRLGKLGDIFGQFVMMHFQSAVFRRPGREQTRAPHVLYVDEFPRYVNPDFERLLAIGRSFRCACVLALQTTSQLLLEEKPAFRDIVLENCRNKIVLNLGSAEDAKRFAAEFGENRLVKRSKTYKRDAVILFPDREDSVREDEKFEPRFAYTELMELPKFTCVYRVVRDGQPMRPGRAKLKLCEWDLRRSGRAGWDLAGWLARKARGQKVAREPVVGMASGSSSESSPQPAMQRPVDPQPAVMGQAQAADPEPFI